MRSRFLMECTTPEVDEYLARGGRTALLPVGSVEMHGPHQPLGTDSLVATAFALRLAEAADGVVLPEVHYTWAGSTDGFAGTLSVEADLVQKIVEGIALKVFRMGLRHLLVLSIHAGNRSPLYLAARQIYEKHHIPLVYIDPYEPLGEDAGSIFAGEYQGAKEASLVLASLHILGKPDLYSEKEMRYDDQAPPFPSSFRAITRVGVVGYFMQDPRQHACPSVHVSLERGLDFMAKQVKHIVPILEHIDEYSEVTEAQRNKGWWKND
jgi:creatinine amidohydrolase